MVPLLIAGALSLAASLLGTRYLIDWLKAHSVGQPIHEDVPDGHITKAGTPTMGGVAIVVAAVVGYGAAHVHGGLVFTRSGVCASRTREWVYETVPVVRSVSSLCSRVAIWYEPPREVFLRSITSEKSDRRLALATPNTSIEPYMTRPCRSVFSGSRSLRFTKTKSESARVTRISPVKRVSAGRLRS